MKNMRAKITRSLATASGAGLWALASAGCGGGGNGGPVAPLTNPPAATSPAASRGAGAVSLSVRWPERSRLIPDAAQSIRVEVRANGADVAAPQVLARPASGSGTVTARFDGIVPGEVVLVATALPNANGSGVAQAVASVPVTVVEDQVVPASVVMQSTITAVTVGPAAPSVASGSDVVLAATARDAAGAAVPTAPARLNWQVTGGGGSATLAPQADGSVRVTGGNPGTVEIRATETESGVAGAVTLTVGPPVPKTPVVVAFDTLAGGGTIQSSEGFGIGPSGLVVGRVQVDGVQRPFRSRPDGALETLGGGPGAAYDINAGGAAVGSQQFAAGGEQREQAFLWPAGSSAATNLSSLNREFGYSRAFSISDDGHIVGTSRDSCGCHRPFLTQKLTPIAPNVDINNGHWGDDVGSFRGKVLFIHCYAYGLNNKLQLTGDSSQEPFSPAPPNPLPHQAFRYTASFAIDTLTNLPSPVSITRADALAPLDDFAQPATTGYAINENGDVAGWQGMQMNNPGSIVASWTQERAVYWLAGGGKQLVPTLGGATSRAYGINAARQIVGWSDTGATRHAFLFDAATGVLKDLNDYAPAGWEFKEARGINDRGQVVIIAREAGKTPENLRVFRLDLNP